MDRNDIMRMGLLLLCAETHELDSRQYQKSAACLHASKCRARVGFVLRQMTRRVVASLQVTSQSYEVALTMTDSVQYLGSEGGVPR